MRKCWQSWEKVLEVQIRRCRAKGSWTTKKGQSPRPGGVSEEGMWEEVYDQAALGRGEFPSTEGFLSGSWREDEVIEGQLDVAIVKVLLRGCVDLGQPSVRLQRSCEPGQGSSRTGVVNSNVHRASK